MREQFIELLSRLNRLLILMGATCESAVACAVKALTTGEPSLAAKARELERETDRSEREIEDLCLGLLLRQQPVARDLRLVSAAMKITTDMERIGDQAADIAELVAHVDPDAAQRIGGINEMSRTVIEMVSQSVEAFVRRDTELAKSVIAEDERADSFFLQIKGCLAELISRDRESGEAALDTLMIAKYLERIGDHAVNIAEWVVYAVTGEHKAED